MIYAKSNSRIQSKMTANPLKYPNKSFKDKGCTFCGKVFTPLGPSHHYCSESCRSLADSQRYYKRNYNSSLQEVDNLFEAQGGVCAICGSPGFRMNDRTRLTLVLDHSHKTGVVRGLLCHNCNRALGLLGDSVDVLKSATKYLESSE